MPPLIFGPNRNNLLLSQFAFNSRQVGMLGLEDLEWKTASSFYLVEDDLKYLSIWKTASNIFVNGRQPKTNL